MNSAGAEAVAIMKKNAAEWGAHGAEKIIAAGRFDWLMSMPADEMAATLQAACRAHLDDYFRAQFPGGFGGTIPESTHFVWRKQWMPAFTDVLAKHATTLVAAGVDGSPGADLYGQIQADLAAELDAAGLEDAQVVLLAPDGSQWPVK
jgi:hypothetical protein